MWQRVAEVCFAAIDFESAGAAKGATDSPVQIGMACWSCQGGHRDPFVSYLRTDQPVQWSAQRVHGISTADLADAPPLLSLWPEVRNRLSGAVVVAHGKGTERRFLRSFPGHGFGPWLDTLPLSRALWPQLPDHALSSVCTALGLAERAAALVPLKTWHDALFDAVASLLILEHAVATLGLADHPVAGLLRPDTTEWRNSRYP